MIHVAPLLTVVSSLSSLRFFVAGIIGAGRAGLRRPGADVTIRLSHSTLGCVGGGGESPAWIVNNQDGGLLSTLAQHWHHNIH